MTDWADETALRVAGSPTDIAIALRTERELARQAIASVEDDAKTKVAALKDALAASERRSLDRKRTLAGIASKRGRAIGPAAQRAYEARFAAEDCDRGYVTSWSDRPPAARKIWRRVAAAVMGGPGSAKVVG